MPTVNLITAPTVVHVSYAEPTYPVGHIQRLYFDCSTLQDVDGIITLDGVINPDTSDDWLLHDVIVELWRRVLTEHSTFVPLWQIGLVAVWSNIPDPVDEVFVGFDASDYTDLVQGTAASGFPYGQMTWNMQSSDRSNARIVFGGLYIPFTGHRIPTTVPAVDDDSVEWFLMRSNVPFSTNDGEQFDRYVSRTTAHNKALTKKYPTSF